MPGEEVKYPTRSKSCGPSPYPLWLFNVFLPSRLFWRALQVVSEVRCGAMSFGAFRTLPQLLRQVNVEEKSLADMSALSLLDKQTLIFSFQSLPGTFKATLDMEEIGCSSSSHFNVVEKERKELHSALHPETLLKKVF